MSFYIRLEDNLFHYVISQVFFFSSLLLILSLYILVCGFRTFAVRLVKRTQCVIFYSCILASGSLKERKHCKKKLISTRHVRSLGNMFHKKKRKKCSSWYTLIYIRRHLYIKNNCNSCIYIHKLNCI